MARWCFRKRSVPKQREAWVSFLSLTIGSVHVGGTYPRQQYLGSPGILNLGYSKRPQCSRKSEMIETRWTKILATRTRSALTAF